MMDHLDFLKPIADKINSIDSKIDQARLDQENAKTSESKFLKLFTTPYGKYILYGILCLVALLFDFFVNKTTLIWLDRLTGLPVEVFAIIFLVIDGCVAVLAAGLLAKDYIEKTKQRNMWRPVLWGLGIVKIVLFVVFVSLVQKGSGNIDWVMTGIQILFVALIYIILDNSGSGLYFLLGKLWHLFIQQIWIDTPEDLKRKKQLLFRKLDESIKKLNSEKLSVDKDEVYKHFGLREVKS